MLCGGGVDGGVSVLFAFAAGSVWGLEGLCGVGLGLGAWGVRLGVRGGVGNGGRGWCGGSC